MTNVDKYRLKEIIKLLKPIETNDLNNWSNKKNCNLSNYSLPKVNLKGIYEGRISMNDTHGKESIFYNNIKRAKHGRINDIK